MQPGPNIFRINIDKCFIMRKLMAFKASMKDIVLVISIR